MAEIGDMVEFQFMSMNHTVTQSTFPLPCVKMELGKDSGFKPNPKDAMSPPPSWTFQVMTKSPICKLAKHCRFCECGADCWQGFTADKRAIAVQA